jgi:PAS domain S-box-containing protein
MKNHTSTALADDDQEDSNAGHRRADSGRKCAQAALKESEKGFRTLCEASLAGIYIIQNGCIKYANPALAGALAYQPEELHGISWSVLVHPDDRPVVEEHHRRRLTGEWQASRYEMRCVRKDGEVIHVDVLGSRIEYAGSPALIGTMLEHLRSERFRRLLPYIEMSVEPPQVAFSTIDQVRGIEFLVAVLSPG